MYRYSKAQYLGSKLKDAEKIIDDKPKAALKDSTNYFLPTLPQKSKI
jgi:hypothetical protein